MMIHHWRLFKNLSSLKWYGCNLIGLLVSLRCRGGKQPESTWLRYPHHLQHIHALWQYSQCFPISAYVSICEEPGPYISSKQLWLLSAHRRSLFNLCGKHATIFQTQADRADASAVDTKRMFIPGMCYWFSKTVTAREKKSVVLYRITIQNDYKYTIA